jgi:catechol 2,3-dioxygenase-like lactoylglutathione lyase family enzyme
MPLHRIEHYLVLTEDLEKTRAFYVDALGLNVGWRPQIPFPGFWLYLGDIPCVHVAEWETYRAYSEGTTGIPISKKATGTGPIDHMAFKGTDYDGVVAHLKQLGIQPHSNVVLDGGLRQLFFIDPNGVKIEVNFAPGS